MNIFAKWDEHLFLGLCFISINSFLWLSTGHVHFQIFFWKFCTVPSTGFAVLRSHDALHSNTYERKVSRAKNAATLKKHVIALCTRCEIHVLCTWKLGLYFIWLLLWPLLSVDVQTRTKTLYTYDPCTIIRHCCQLP